MSSFAKRGMLLSCPRPYKVGPFGHFPKIQWPFHLTFFHSCWPSSIKRKFLPLDCHNAAGVTVCGLRLGHKRSCSFLLGFLDCFLWKKPAAMPKRLSSRLSSSPVEGPGPQGKEPRDPANKQLALPCWSREWTTQDVDFLGPCEPSDVEAPAIDFSLMRYPKPEVLRWALLSSWPTETVRDAEGFKPQSLGVICYEDNWCRYYQQQDSTSKLLTNKGK